MERKDPKSPTAGIFCVGVLMLTLRVDATFAQSTPFTPPDLTPLIRADVDSVSDIQLFEHARWLDENLDAHHDSYGVVFRAIYADPEDTEPKYCCSGGDSALFTGYRLAAATYRLRTLQRPEDLDRVFRVLQGVHLLTHVSGTPGVIARVAFPAKQKKRFRYPGAWGGRMFALDDDRRRALYGRPGPYLYESEANVANVLHEHGIEIGGERQEPCYPQMIFYTRTSRDQLTGLLFGLAVASTELEPESLPEELRAGVHTARLITEQILEDIFLLLEERGRPNPDRFRSEIEWGPAPRLRDITFVIRDHLGHSGSAGRIEPLLRAALFGTYRAVLERRVQRGELPANSARLQEVTEATRAVCEYFGPFNLDFLLNPLCRSYFPWNLRWASAYSLYLVDPDPSLRDALRDYVESTMWCYTKDDQNSFFSLLDAVMHGREHSSVDEAIRGLRSLALRQSPVTGSLRSFSSPLYGQGDGHVLPPHLRLPGGYFLWQKEPDEPDGEAKGDHLDREGLEEGTGLDFTLPYWLGRAKGLIADPTRATTTKAAEFVQLR